MKRMQLVAIVLLLASAVLPGCLHTQSEVAVKPVDINLNITGRLEVVITDARKQEEEITGQKPKRTVTPEDIGLPAATANATNPGAMLTDPDWKLADGWKLAKLLLVADVYAAQPGDRTQLIQQMAARHSQIASMLDSRLVGESHTGFLVPKANLTAAQQALVDAENPDRTELYKLEAASKNTPVDQVALAYYMARLEHVGKGTWVERYNKATGAWEWFQWNR
jgi:uncharacterized protein YdbL (DUF1318 family)